MRTALLFDLDGTLVDTDAQHLVAFQNVFARHGVAIDKAGYTKHVMGASNAMIADSFLQHLSAAEQRRALDDKEAWFRERADSLHPVKGAAELLDFADAHRLRRAVVTNAPRENADLMLAAIGFAARLPILVVGGELARPKPDPMPYLRGLELTQCGAAQSLAFEDSLSGLRAARGAGLAVVGLTTTLDAATLTQAGAAIAAADFSDARIYDLLRAKMAA
jgi:beta-phosphoglucomutase